MARWEGKLNRIDDYRWEIPMSYKQGMRVPGMVYADEKMLETIKNDQSLEQVVNVAFLPGIVGHSLAMPDIHWGYGFPIGGVAATRVNDGVVSPGGVGYDINCGVRLLRTKLSEEEVRPKIRELVNHLFQNVPSGLGSKGKIKIKDNEMNEVMTQGAHWAVNRGLGLPRDLEVTEETGRMKNADPAKISERARQRGTPQSGTLGSGNHFIEIQVVKEIYDKDAAGILGIKETGQVLLLIHTGSRGFGHQVCEDFLKVMIEAVRKYNISLPDRQLVCAPVESKEGKDYLAAMACAANYAWANRQCITQWARESFVSVFGKNLDKIGLEQIYDVAHNIAKIEEYTIDGKKLKLCIHRKGATRAFPPGHPDIPQQYQSIGQPVLIPGDMGRRSYIALGTEKAMKESFGSTCHGAGRVQSRGAAKRSLKGINIAKELESRGIIVKAASMGSLAEEASEAYKDVTQVVEVTHQAGISRKIVMAEPMGTIKG
jgi:tRNA-splicing ligase RtcB (3'-phosphate/5'-hydroxy nucleic acid ligase)